MSLNWVLNAISLVLMLLAELKVEHRALRALLLVTSEFQPLVQERKFILIDFYCSWASRRKLLFHGEIRQNLKIYGR